VNKYILDIQSKIIEESYVRIPHSSMDYICGIKVSEQEMISI
jgi:hypothetical protein